MFEQLQDQLRDEDDPLKPLVDPNQPIDLQPASPSAPQPTDLAYYADRPTSPNPLDAFNPTQASPTTGIAGGGGATQAQQIAPSPAPTPAAAPPMAAPAPAAPQAAPWSGAPANNPTAAPEQGYWGSDTGSHSQVYTPQQAEFQRFFNDYWAPDRAQVLASMRYGAGQKQVSAPTAGAAPSGGYQPMEGVDVNKLNDPTHTTPKYVASRILASGGDINQAAAAIGATVLDATRMRLPSGEVIDIRRDEEGANALQWLVQGGGDGGGSSGAAGASSVMGSTLGGQQGASGAPSNSAFSDQVRQLLMQQLGGLSGPVTGNDPQIKAEMDAQGNVLERNRRDRRSADAERAAMQGLLNGGQSSGSFEQNIASGFEDKGQALTGIQAQLFTRELQSRRSHIANLLNMAMQSGDNESARNLQYTLAMMDDTIRRMSLQQNQSQFNDQFGLQAGRFQYEKDRDLAGYGTGAR